MNQKERRIISIGRSNYVSLPKKMMEKFNLQSGDFIRLEKITKVKMVEVEEDSRQRKLPTPREVNK